VALEVVAELVPLEPSSAGGAGALGGPSGLFCEVRPATMRNILPKRNFVEIGLRKIHLEKLLVVCLGTETASHDPLSTTVVHANRRRLAPLSFGGRFLTSDQPFT
jgi:hypothetical protein